MLNQKRGWIKIVEAFIALMLILTVLLIVINKGYIGKNDISSKVYDVQLSILREIELNDDYRGDILSAIKDRGDNENSLPIPWEQFEGEGLSEIKKLIGDRSPNYLTCVAKICEMDLICESNSAPINKDIYVQSVAITATLDEYAPRQLKLFCWVE